MPVEIPLLSPVCRGVISATAMCTWVETGEVHFLISCRNTSSNFWASLWAEQLASGIPVSGDKLRITKTKQNKQKSPTDFLKFNQAVFSWFSLCGS